MGNNPPIAYNRDPPGGDSPPTLILGSRYLKTTFVSWIRCIDGKFLNLDRNACIFLAVFQSDNGRGACVVCPPENIIVIPIIEPAIAINVFLPIDFFKKK